MPLNLDREREFFERKFRDQLDKFYGSDYKLFYEAGYNAWIAAKDESLTEIYQLKGDLQAEKFKVKLFADVNILLKRALDDLCVTPKEAKAGATRSIAMQKENEELKKEVKHWKANHQNMVDRARVLIERTDMPIERTEFYKKYEEIQFEVNLLNREKSIYAELVNSLKNDIKELQAELEIAKKEVENLKNQLEYQKSKTLQFADAFHEKEAELLKLKFNNIKQGLNND